LEGALELIVTVDDPYPMGGAWVNCVSVKVISKQATVAAPLVG
jgi:hypothetical protein